MTIGNTERGYGWLARSLHWLVAALILTSIVLGLRATGMTQESPDQIADTIRTFSWHKTVGMGVLVFAVLRLIWALTQPKPRRLNADNRLEAALATWVNWSLYLGMIIVPLSGWLRHASAPGGFSEILWPFGQRLPFLPENAALSDIFAAFHTTGWWVLAGLIVLHILGALKHALIDRDRTMERMFRSPDKLPQPPETRPALSKPMAAILALVLWAATTAVAMTGISGQPPLSEPIAPAANIVTSAPTEGHQWIVQSGELSIEVQQGASPVQGSFANWQAAIAYDPDTQLGQVSVDIDIASLVLGSVSDMAKGPQFLNDSEFPQAKFSGQIQPVTEGSTDLVVRGELTIAGHTIPADLPFELVVQDDEAKATGQMTVDRRDFEVGATYPDESSVGFAVKIGFDLTATR